MITQLHQFNGIDRTVQLQHHFTSITIYSKFNYNTTSLQLQYMHNMTDSTSSYSFLNHPHGTWGYFLFFSQPPPRYLITVLDFNHNLNQLQYAWPAIRYNTLCGLSSFMHGAHQCSWGISSRLGLHGSGSLMCDSLIHNICLSRPRLGEHGPWDRAAPVRDR
jgi:hypothetical protein